MEVKRLVSLKDMASLHSVSYRTLYRAHKFGRRAKDGSLVKLHAERSIHGLATSHEAMEEFHQRLNQ